MPKLDISKLTAKNEGAFRLEDLPYSLHFMEHSCWEYYWRNLHYHNEYIEILLAYKGDFDIYLNGEITRLYEGSLFVVNTGELHATLNLQNEKENNNSQLMCIKFMPELLYPSTRTATDFRIPTTYMFDSFKGKRYFSPEEVKKLGVVKDFEYIAKEQSNGKFGHQITMRSATVKIFTLILREWFDRAVEREPNILNSATFRTIEKIKNYVNENYETATLQSAADACELSYSYLSRVFNQYMDMSFSDYVNLTRINRSMEMLTTSNSSITDIALAVGFSSTSHYIQTFKKHKSISPNKFRKMFKS